MVRVARRWGATHLMGTGPPFSSLIAASVAARRTGLPFLADLQDSWTIHPDTHYPTPAHRAIDEWLERSVWEEASAVTVVTRTIASRYASRYPEWTSKIRLLYNGYDPEDLPASPSAREEGFTIAYTGSFYPHSPPSTLLAAVERLMRGGAIPIDRFHVDFVGRPEDSIRREVSARGLTHVVRIHGFRPLQEAVATAATADLLYLLIPAHFGEALSDKLFMYLATGNPILAEVPEGECKDFLQEWGGNVRFVPPGDVDAMEAAIRAALTGDARRTQPHPRHADFRVAFSRDTQARQLGEILEALA